MAVVSHTPGPWGACKAGDCECGFIWSGCGNIHVASAHGPADLGQSWFGGDIACGRDEQKANARLIAAAPDLLAACRDWIEWLDCDDGSLADVGAEREAEMLDAMRAAIARAEAL